MVPGETAMSAKITDDDGTTPFVIPGRRREPGYVRVYRELLQCYIPLIGLDGIGYWTLLADHRHNGGKAEELTGKAWPSQRTIRRQTRMGFRRIGALNDKLQAAGLLEIDRADGVFTEAQLGDLRRRGIYLQPDSYIYVIHEPLTFDQFCEQNFGGPCQRCEHRYRCKAFELRWKIRRDEQPESDTRYRNDSGGATESEAGVLPKRLHNENEQPKMNNNAVAALLDCGVSEETARRLATTYESDYLKRQIAWVCWQHQRGKVVDLAAYLVAAIEKGWQAPAGYLAERATEQQQQADQVRWVELRELERQTRAALGYDAEVVNNGREN
jgi:hypothetical protein